jgi:hypothetical protein
MDKTKRTTRTLAAQQTSAPVEAGDVASTIGATLHRAKQFTSAPVEPGVVGSPEFCRPSDVRHLFGIGRSYCYELIQSGAIRSTCLRKAGARTGVRLIDVASVRDYLRGQFNQPTNG